MDLRRAVENSSFFTLLRSHYLLTALMCQLGNSASQYLSIPLLSYAVLGRARLSLRNENKNNNNVTDNKKM